LEKFVKCAKLRHTKITVFNKLYNPSGSANEPIACKYGNNMEPLAINNFENKIGVQVRRCGLYIDEQYPYLGASPCILHESIIKCVNLLNVYTIQ